MIKVIRAIKVNRVTGVVQGIPNYLSYLVFLFIMSCANQVPPSGGPKDVKPPKVLKTVPENYSTNFSSHEVVITFNEYIQLKDLSKQLIISPPLQKPPDVSIHKKSLVIKLKEALKANTTYTMNFGEAIADINEGNILENYQYVFSTGDVLDSLAMKGKVINAFDHKTEKGILVMLYKTDEDSIPYKSRPDYFSRTNDSGQFKITNIAPGDYKIFALKETNSNYLFDSRDENIAFANQLVTAGKGDSIRLQLFKEMEKQRVTNAYSETPGKALLAFNLPVRSLSITPVNDSSKISLMEFSAKNDTVTIWYENRELDSLNLFVSDTLMKTDTVTIRLFKTSSKSLKGKEAQLKLNIISSIANDGFADLDKNLLLTFSHPLKEADLAQLSLTEDSIPVKDFTMHFVDSVKRKLSITKKWKEKTTYKLFIPPATVTDMYGQKNDTFQLKFRTRSMTDYGTLALQVYLPQSNHHYLLQLIDEKDNIYRQEKLASDTILHLEYLQPRKYRLKLIDDINNNGEWDTGNYMQHLQPEETIYYGEEINVRANWDVETTWSVK